MSATDATRDDARTSTAAWALRAAVRAAPGPAAILAWSALAAGTAPAAIAWVGRLIVDAVVVALGARDGWAAHRGELHGLLGIEASLVAVAVVAARAQGAAQALLRVRLAQALTERVLDKALALDLLQLEDPAIRDRLDRARRDAGSRPFEAAVGAISLARSVVAVVTSVALLAALSPLAVLLVVAAGLPLFVAELRFSQRAFEGQRERSPAAREQTYLESLLAREDVAKEVKVYALGPHLLGRIRAIGASIARDERALALRRGAWGVGLQLVGTSVFYGAYAWIVERTVREHLSLGEMTMYIAVFRQAQAAVTSGLASLGQLLDDRLYVRELRAFLSTEPADDAHAGAVGPDPSAGLVVSDLAFSYPGASAPTLDGVSFTLAPGEHVALVGANGSGKSTLLKLITGLYAPTRGRVVLDGLDVRGWDRAALRRRFSPLFQDPIRLKTTAGENIGAGDVGRFDDEEGWARAATESLADGVVAALPGGYHARLGKWRHGGAELSGGQWQRLALARSRMRQDTPILLLDEPTASLDPEAERGVLARLRARRGRQAALVVSHRGAAVRDAERVLVLDAGRIVESGTHESLVARGGLYARRLADAPDERTRDADAAQ